jgi:hypothetical protein
MTIPQALLLLADGCLNSEHVANKLQAAGCMEQPTSGLRCTTCPVAQWLMKHVGQCCCVAGPFAAFAGTQTDYPCPAVVQLFIAHYDAHLLFLSKDGKWLLKH